MNVSKNYPPKFDMAIDIGINYMIIKKIGAENYFIEIINGDYKEKHQLIIQ